MSKGQHKDIIYCFLIECSNEEFYHNEETGDLVAIVSREADQEYPKVERQPPYYQILPCPYCRTTDNRKHEDKKHINPKLGVSL